MLMKQKKMLALTLSQLVLLYRQEFPGLAALADASGDGERFRMGLREFVDAHRAAEGEAAEQIRLLIDYDGRSVRELSTDRQLEVRTLTLLWQFLTGRLENPEMPSDLFVDLYHLFRLLDAPEIPLPSPRRVRSRTERWLSGQDDGVRAIRADNRERMLHLLIQKIENRKSKVPSRFQFADGMTYEEKYRQVAAWWGDFRFQLAMAVKSPSELNRFLAGSLSSETMYLLSKARKKGMPFFATPYYLSLLDVTGGGYDDAAIRSYILYSPQLVETYGQIRAWEREDVVEAGRPNAAGWLLPDGHNIHRRYPEVAILIPDTMGRACGGLCASCQRMYDFQSERLNFEFETLRPVTGGGYDDAAIRSYILYSPQLVETYGQIRAWEREDVVEAGRPNAAGWLLPDGHNIHRRYPEVAILIPDTMGRACGGLCASCQRMYDFQSERLNFEFETLRPKESWDHKLRRLMNYFEEDTQLRDILITGGDALMSQNKTLRNILEAVCRMAGRKRRANARRPDGEKYAELQRVRLGSRLPAYLPMRVNDELVEILREFREKASAVGVKQFIIQTHFQTPLEVTPEAEEAIRKILSAGWLITNQLVYTVAASRRGHTTRLRQVLNSLGVVCYYTFSVKGFQENYAVFTPNSRSMQEQVEEKVYGRLTPEQAAELDDLLADGTDTAAKIRRFMRRHHLPFLATDRSVLNLPAIGKSMSFRLVGITAEGKRLLRFDHDRTRRHSPIIDSMGEIFIVENKSLAAYLRQLGKMGEDPEDYASIWAYTHGETEPRFGLYVYPDFGFATTDRVSNLELE